MTEKTDGPPLRRPPVGLLRGASLFLDFDGTLVDIAPTPDAVRVSAKLRDLLERLRERLGGRLVILTGRAASDVHTLLEPVILSVGGHHGLEPPGVEGAAIERPSGLDAVIAGLRRLENDHPGVLVEEKPLGVALHFRKAPGAAEACRIAAERAAERSGLEVQPGKMVFELKPSGGNKGSALLRLMSKPPFAGTVPVFLGDDLTDEPAFAAARDFGGAGVLIGDRGLTAAVYRLDSVAAATEWLEQAIQAA